MVDTTEVLSQIWEDPVPKSRSSVFLMQNLVTISSIVLNFKYLTPEYLEVDILNLFPLRLHQILISKRKILVRKIKNILRSKHMVYETSKNNHDGGKFVSFIKR